MTDKIKMKKRMKIMLICIGTLFGSIFIYKIVMGLILTHMMASQSQVVTVSAMNVEYLAWQPKLKATGSLRAVRGVNVTTELAGMVQTIYFMPGATVKEGSTLVQLKADADIALLHSLEANAELAQTIYKRDKAQYAVQAISKTQLDTDAANLKSLQAQVIQQTTIVNKKTIQAPFSGHLGISAVNPGQYVNAGDKVVTLQQLDPIYVDFYLPQQNLVQLRTGEFVEMSVDTFPGKTFFGKITTIDPIVDINTRNVQVEATIANPKFELLPGMFASVAIPTGAPQRYLTLPQTAISFNPYGDIVYIIKKNDKGKKLTLIATQNFVTTGETRGDQIAVLQGLKKDDLVVTSGQLKLKNGSEVTINNSIVPENNPTPIATDEY